MVVVLRRRVLHHHRSDFPRSFAERERERQKERREKRVLARPVVSSARSLTLSFFLLLSDFTKNIIFISFKFDFFLFLD
jgi:hypothetical protein